MIMTRKNKALTNLVFLPFIAVSLNACLPLVAGGAALVGTSIAEERTAGDQVDDNVVMLKIKEKFASSDHSSLLEGVSVTVSEGRVMLTGHADSHKEANEAAKLAWKVKGAKEVINEVEVGKKKFRDSAADALTISAIRSKLLLDGDINSVNYGLDVNNGCLRPWYCTIKR
jgi:osmotically-inducible protein OsmY